MYDKIIIVTYKKN